MDALKSGFVWICHQCNRRVPKRIGVCGCGFIPLGVSLPATPSESGPSTAELKVGRRPGAARRRWRGSAQGALTGVLCLILAVLGSQRDGQPSTPIALAVVWAALILNGRPSEATTPKPGLVLTWIDPKGLVPFASAVRREVENLFEDIDCDVRWRREERPDLQSGKVELRVVLMPSKPAKWSLPPHAMGVVFANQVASSRSLYIFSPAIVLALGYAPSSLSRFNLPPRERRLLIRGFGRVIAHEVFHAIAPTLPHADDGLTSSTLDRNFLARPKTSINAKSAAVFCQELAKLAAMVVARESLPEAE